MNRRSFAGKIGLEPLTPPGRFVCAVVVNKQPERWEGRPSKAEDSVNFAGLGDKPFEHLENSGISKTAVAPLGFADGSALSKSSVQKDRQKRAGILPV
jgi:hypothetical protein